jgi:hypothetical protein
MDPHSSTSIGDPTIELREAIQKLEAFSKQKAEEYKSSPVSKTISLMRSFLLNPLVLNNSKVGRKKRAAQTDILQAVEVVNRERLLIQKLQKGTPAEQKLAESFTKIIAIYNETLEKRLQHRYSKKILKLFSKEFVKAIQDLPKIALPHKNSLEYHYPEHPPKLERERFTSPLQHASDIFLSQQSVELFHMKTLSLLERYGIATNPEARSVIKQSPIYTIIEGDSSKCTLSQTLTLFPGQVIHVIGTSELDPKNRTIRRFSPETFSISLESNQTGFPHPLQRTGWTLTHSLLHDCPQRIDLLHYTAEVLEKKKSIISTLLPHTPLMEKAKSLLKIRKRVFENKIEEFIDLHKQLALTIARAAYRSPFPSFEFIDHFFMAALNHPKAFDWLSETNQMISEFFITKPHQTLIHSILNQSAAKFGSQDSVKRFLALKELFDTILIEAKKNIASLKAAAGSANEQVRLNYVEEVGKIFASSAQTIILQYLSEDLMFQPPKLQLFDQKVQAATYQHVLDFANELSTPFEAEPENEFEKVYVFMKQKMQADILLFEKDHKLEIPKELSHYFELRHLSLRDCLKTSIG